MKATYHFHPHNPVQLLYWDPQQHQWIGRSLYDVIGDRDVIVCSRTSSDKPFEEQYLVDIHGRIWQIESRISWKFKECLYYCHDHIDVHSHCDWLGQM